MTADQEKRLVRACYDVSAAFLNGTHRAGPHAWDSTANAIGRMLAVLHEFAPDDDGDDE